MRVIRTLIFSNFFTSASVALLTWCTYSVLNDLQIRFYVIISVFLGSWMLYNFHRIYKVDMISVELLADRHRWLLDRPRLTKWIMGLSAFVLMFILPNYNMDSIIWLIPAAVVSIGYTVPFIPVKKHWWRLRDIPLLKPVIIALVVTYLTLDFPVFEQMGISGICTVTVIKLNLERFVFLVAVTIPFEMRDMANDKNAGLATVATKFGFSVAKKTAFAFILLWLVLMLWRWFEMELGIPYLLGSGALFLTYAAGLWRTKLGSKEEQYNLIFEGLIVVYACFYLLTAN